MKKKFDPLKIAFVCSGALLLFIYGVAVGIYEIFPYRIIKFTGDSAHQVWRELPSILRIRPQKFLTPARYDGNGVTRNIDDQVTPGLTFMSGFFGDTNEMRLVRQNGEIINRWPVQFTVIFSDPSHIEPATERPTNDWGTDIHGALALPDGSVVFNFEYMGLVKLDRCGAVQWALPKMTHHSIDMAKDGSFWVGGRYFENSNSKFPAITAPYYEDTLLKVSSEGIAMTEISVPGLFYKNHLEYLLFSNGDFSVTEPRKTYLSGGQEITHINDIEELRPEMAEQFPQFKTGDLLLSFRNLNLLMVVDPDNQIVKWHQTGPFIRQHDPDFKADGTISVFNNNTDDTKDGNIFGGSNIIDIDPKSGKLVVRYGAEERQNMYSRVRGRHQTLGNGNILITESMAGRVFEIDRAGSIVWEFINRYDENNVTSINDAIRYPEDYFTVKDWSCK